MRSASARVGLTKRRRSERKVTRMVVVMVLVFLICWLPFFVTNMVNLIHIIPVGSTTIYFIIVILTYLNSCINPFLYGFLSENFKQSFQKVLCAYKPDGVDAVDQRRAAQNTSRNPTQEAQCLQVCPHHLYAEERSLSRLQTSLHLSFDHLETGAGLRSIYGQP